MILFSPLFHSSKLSDHILASLFYFCFSLGDSAISAPKSFSLASTNKPPSLASIPFPPLPVSAILRVPTPAWQSLGT